MSGTAPLSSRWGAFRRRPDDRVLRTSPSSPTPPVSAPTASPLDVFKLKPAEQVTRTVKVPLLPLEDAVMAVIKSAGGAPILGGDLVAKSLLAHSEADAIKAIPDELAGMATQMLVRVARSMAVATLSVSIQLPLPTGP